MNGALVYLEACSWGNRLRMQARRLRKPKYLLGALVGGAYFFFLFIGPMLGMGPRGARLAVSPLGDGVRPLVEMLGALGMAAMVLLTWLLPSRRAAVNFSEAEIAFLFPAPLSRRTLIHYHILRAQIPILLSSLLMMVFTGRFASGGHWWWHWIGWWLVVSALEMHRLGAMFVMTRLLDEGMTPSRRRWLVFGVAGVVLMVLVAWVRATVPAPAWDKLGGLTQITDYLKQVAVSGPAFWLLLPFRLLLRPMLAADGVAFALAVLPALAVVAALYAWAVRSEASFEEATLEFAERRAKVVAAMRAGNWHLTRSKRRRIGAPFRLRPTGPRAVALLWKNLISAGNIFTIRLWAGVGIGVVTMAAICATTTPGALAPKIVTGMLIAWTPLLFWLGPQMMVMDFRQDLAAMELLKTWPLPGRQVVLGEVLAPVTILTVVQWLFVTLILVSSGAIGGVPVTPATRVAWGAGVMILAPGINLISQLLVNGVVLLFPAWVKLGGLGRGQGFEAMGQQMLMMLGQMLALGLALVVPAGLFALVFFGGRAWLPVWLVVPSAALTALTALLAEAYAALCMLGDWFERMDVSDEPAV